MNTNEIKKVLYKEKPIAKKQKLRTLPKTHLHYMCYCSVGVLNFLIPIDEGKDFEDEIQAQLLIRWLN